MTLDRSLRILFGALLFAAPVVIAAQTASSVDLSHHFAGLDGTFVLLNEATGQYVRHNPARAAQRFAPCSTFKIPNTAILLESGTAPDPSLTLKYDPALKLPAQWARDFDLRSAYRISALWYYQALSTRLGVAEEQRYLRRFEYGNADVSGGMDVLGNPFWVDGSLRISPDEQIQFLRRFRNEQLGLSSRTTQLTKEIMLAEETPTWKLFAKTGACQPQGEQTSNWYVGYVEGAAETYYFALQIGASDYGRAYAGRIPISRAILTQLKILQ